MLSLNVAPRFHFIVHKNLDSKDYILAVFKDNVRIVGVLENVSDYSI